MVVVVVSVVVVVLALVVVALVVVKAIVAVVMRSRPALLSQGSLPSHPSALNQFIGQMSMVGVVYGLGFKFRV